MGFRKNSCGTMALMRFICVQLLNVGTLFLLVCYKKYSLQ